ncbi:hypothetical protein BDZ91DRAFT_828169 [Kalaharituber pfeilii]|nr:hypothetical protein BDZ91DRAFT_828169 [Kalaharituber pfeilii]
MPRPHKRRKVGGLVSWAMVAVQGVGIGAAPYNTAGTSYAAWTGGRGETPSVERARCWLSSTVGSGLELLIGPHACGGTAEQDRGARVSIGMAPVEGWLPAPAHCGARTRKYPETGRGCAGPIPPARWAHKVQYQHLPPDRIEFPAEWLLRSMALPLAPICATHPAARSAAIAHCSTHMPTPHRILIASHTHTHPRPTNPGPDNLVSATPNALTLPLPLPLPLPQFETQSQGPPTHPVAS